MDDDDYLLEGYGSEKKNPVVKRKSTPRIYVDEETKPSTSGIKNMQSRVPEKNSGWASGTNNMLPPVPTSYGGRRRMSTRRQRRRRGSRRKRSEKRRTQNRRRRH